MLTRRDLTVAHGPTSHRRRTSQRMDHGPPAAWKWQPDVHLSEVQADAVAVHVHQISPVSVGIS